MNSLKMMTETDYYLNLGQKPFDYFACLKTPVFAPEDSLALALDLLVLPLSLLDVLALLDEVTWLLLGVLSAELDSLWLEQAVSKATEERVTMEARLLGKICFS